MTTDDSRLGVGGNKPPSYDQEVLEKAEKLTRDALAAAKEQFALGPIMDEDRAKIITDVVARVGAASKAVEVMRVAEKKPHDVAAEEVQKAFGPLKESMKTDSQKLKDMAADWMTRETARKAKEQAARESEARRVQEQAWAEQQMAEARGDTLGATRAAEAAADAEKAVAAAAKPVSAKMESASGAGRTLSMRTQVYAEITKIRSVFLHFEDHPDVKEVLQRLANAAIRAGETVPGADKAERQIAA